MRSPAMKNEHGKGGAEKKIRPGGKNF